MDAFEIAGDAEGTSLRFVPAESGRTLMIAQSGETQACVTLDPAWLRPVAAWFAGEAQPVALGDRPGELYGRHLDVFGDEHATIWSTRTWARLDCRMPFGTARVITGPRGRALGVTVMLSPGTRSDIAVRLRRLNAELAV